MKKVLGVYYEINNNLLNNYEAKNRNFQILQNIKEINSKNDLLESLKFISEDFNFNYIINMYNIIFQEDNDIQTQNIDINNEEKKEIKNDVILNNPNDISTDNLSSGSKLNQVTLKYNVAKIGNCIFILGEEFVTNNKNKCYMLLDGQKMEICRSLDMHKLEKILKEKNILEIKLIETKPIFNMSCMFAWCHQLESLEDFSKWDTKNVKGLENLFYRCNKIKSIPDISK